MIRDDRGALQQTVVSPIDGDVLYGLAGPLVVTGDTVATIGRPANGPLCRRSAVAARQRILAWPVGRPVDWRFRQAGPAPASDAFARRDVRVVEGARLEIHLAVRDGVLSIAITVTDSDA